MTHPYYAPSGGQPPQHQLLTNRAMFTEAFAIIPKGTLGDITASYLPFWTGTRLWVLARPMTGFSETFAHYVMEVSPGGGSTQPEPESGAQAVLFVVEGQGTVNVDGTAQALEVGSYVYIPPGMPWTLTNDSDALFKFHWIRKAYQAVDGIELPDVIVSHDRDVVPTEMPEAEGRWATTRFVDPADMRHDMHLNIVSLQPGAVIPFLETHVMEHGLYVLEGKGVYRLNREWVEIEAGDYMWLRAFCPQACYAGGPGPFRYLLYKDVNRHVALKPLG